MEVFYIHVKFVELQWLSTAMTHTTFSGGGIIRSPTLFSCSIPASSYGFLVDILGLSICSLLHFTLDDRSVWNMTSTFIPQGQRVFSMKIEGSPFLKRKNIKQLAFVQGVLYSFKSDVLYTFTSIIRNTRFSVAHIIHVQPISIVKWKLERISHDT